MFGFFNKKKESEFDLSEETVRKLTEEMIEIITARRPLFKTEKDLTDSERDELYNSLFEMLPRALLIDTAVDNAETKRLVSHTLSTIVVVFCHRNNITI